MVFFFGDGQRLLMDNGMDCWQKCEAARSHFYPTFLVLSPTPNSASHASSWHSSFTILMIFFYARYFEYVLHIVSTK